MFAWNVAREHHYKRHEVSLLCIFPCLIFLLLAKRSCFQHYAWIQQVIKTSPQLEHQVVTLLFAQFSAHRERIIFKREACLAISCEPPPL
jgi:hypothetical protein